MNRPSQFEKLLGYITKQADTGIGQVWSSLSPLHQAATVAGLGTAGYGLYNYLTGDKKKRNWLGPTLGLAGLAATGYGLSGGDSTNLLPNLGKIVGMSEPPAPTPKVKPDWEAKYKDWLRRMNVQDHYEADSDAMRSLRSSNDKRLISEDPSLTGNFYWYDTDKLLRLKAMQDVLSNPEYDPLAWTSPEYRHLFQQLSLSSPEQTIKTRQAIAKLEPSLAFMTRPMRPDERDDRVPRPVNEYPWLDLVERARHIPSVGSVFLRDPLLPLLNDHEGKLMQALNKWMDSSEARLAFDGKRYPELYRDGQIAFPARALGSYSHRFDEDIKSEMNRLLRSETLKLDGRDQDKARERYSHLLEFLNRYSAAVRGGL